MDVDGVLTGGEIIHGTGGMELKQFHVQDGMGVTLARRAGILPVVITVRKSEAVAKRSEDLKIAEVHQGITRKWECLKEILKRHGFEPEEVAYVGDDLVDLPVMRRVGLPIAVANATEDVKRNAEWITAREGGRGAVREAVEMILKRDGKWDRVLEDLFEELE
ncbi:MAG: HAD hydrolase family protein [Candidatus Eisenbacteria sp.]|nr:HAD hydrolase family protein [Candidatus Eisenbacteria bacterium]